MKIGIAQINPIVGNFEYNFNKIKEFIEKAKVENCKLLIFPELALSGYMPEDLMLSEDFHIQTQYYLDKVTKLTDKLAVVLGYIDENFSTGKPFYNCVGFIKNRKLAVVGRKRLLPNYDVFNENRFFEKGVGSPVIAIGKYRLGLTICEDGWNTEFAPGNTLYGEDPVKDVVENGADIIVNIAASPFTYKKINIREEMFSSIAKKYSKPVILVNQAGGLDGITFDGHSTVFDKYGKIVTRGKGFAEDFFTVDLTKKYETITPCGFDENELIFKALTCNLKDFIKKIGAKKVHFGLSGGVDSALVAVLSKFAFGAESVTGIMLPSPYSSKSSIDDSVKLAKNLGINLKKIDISDSFKAVYNTVEKSVGEVKGLTEENMQARIRGLLLMAYSNNENSILLNTGNKSEFAVGYATIYGDMCGALSVIGDLYKTKVYELCRWINKNFDNVIPENILTKAPSAELRPNQKDQDSLPPYEVLDKIIELYMEENKSIDDIIDITKQDIAVVKKVINLLLKAEFKRKQAAPILKVTDKAFVTGFRYPISSGFNPFEI